jgi:hypothetical protein
VSRLSGQCGILIISQPYRPPRPDTGIALLFLYINIPSSKAYKHFILLSIYLIIFLKPDYSLFLLLSRNALSLNFFHDFSLLPTIPLFFLPLCCQLCLSRRSNIVKCLLSSLNSSFHLYASRDTTVVAYFKRFIFIGGFYDKLRSCFTWRPTCWIAVIRKKEFHNQVVEKNWEYLLCSVFFVNIIHFDIKGSCFCGFVSNLLSLWWSTSHPSQSSRSKPYSAAW